MIKLFQQIYIKNITYSTYDSIIWIKKMEKNYNIVSYYNILFN